MEKVFKGGDFLPVSGYLQYSSESVMSGSVLTGCGSGSETVEKTEVTATPNPTKAPQKSGTSEKTPANENKSQGTSGEKDNSSAGSSGTSENTQEDTSRTVEEK